MMILVKGHLFLPSSSRNVGDHAPTFGCFVPFPGGGEVRAALGAHEGRGGAGRLGVQVEDPGDALLEAAQVDKLRVRGVRDKMHLGRRRLRRRDLKIFAKSDNIFGDYHQGFRFHISLMFYRTTHNLSKKRENICTIAVCRWWSL